MASKIHTHYPEHITVEGSDERRVQLTFTAFSPESSELQSDDRPDVHILHLDAVDVAHLRDQLNLLLTCGLLGLVAGRGVVEDLMDFGKHDAS